MRRQTTQDFYCFYLYFIVGVFHTVEEHQEVFVSRDEGVESGVKASKHLSSDVDVGVSGGCHEEFVQELVHLDLLRWL